MRNSSPYAYVSGPRRGLDRFVSRQNPLSVSIQDLVTRLNHRIGKQDVDSSQIKLCQAFHPIAKLVLGVDDAAENVWRRWTNDDSLFSLSTSLLHERPRR
jgi:hypothetical protein